MYSVENYSVGIYEVFRGILVELASLKFTCMRPEVVQTLDMDV